MRRQRNTFQMKEQDQIFEEQLNKVEISNLPNNEFKVMTTKILSDQACSDAWMLGSFSILKMLRTRMDYHSEEFNKALENTLEVTDSGLDEAENRSVSWKTGGNH